MRTLILGVLILFYCGCADAQDSIRQVDFKNLSYPLSGQTLGHSCLKWLDISTKRKIKLVNGLYPAGSFSGFILQSVTFGDLTGGGREDAIVTLHFDTDGTQQSDYVYIYSFAFGKPKLLAYFQAGDRARLGLHNVYGENGKLVVELLNPKRSMGDCCSSGFVRVRYQWRNGRFESFGGRESVQLGIEAHFPYPPHWPPDPSTPALQPARVRVSAGVAAENLISKVNPVYPAEAKRDHISGTVVLRVLIDERGNVVNLQTVSSPAAGFSAAAVDAIKQWKYRPYLLNGVPTMIVTTIPVNFMANAVPE